MSKIKISLSIVILTLLGLTAPNTNLNAANGYQNNNCWELIDPNPELMKNGKIITDVKEIFDRRNFPSDPSSPDISTICEVAADGTTKILIPLITEGDVNWEICVDGNYPSNGKLALLGTETFNKCVKDIDAVDLGFTIYGHYAVYEAPSTINDGKPFTDEKREITLNIKYRFPGSTSADSEYDLKFNLVRPPTVYVHGLWSNALTWTMPVTRDPRFPGNAVDYSGSNASAFDQNKHVIEKGINTAIRTYRDNDIAVTKVNLVGHSMGGLLSRIHTNKPTYKNDDNFKDGDVLKIITVNTPHDGSPLAYLLSQFSGDSVVGWAMRWAGLPIGEGAIKDLASGSNALDAIEASGETAHAMVGTGGSAATELIPGRTGQIARILHFFADYNDTLESFQHDGIVGRESQEGGLPDSSQSIFTGLDSIHTAATGSNNYSQKLETILDADPTSNIFNQLPPPRSLRASEQPLLISADSNLHSNDLIKGITITSPISGTAITAGETIEITVSPDSGFNIQRVLAIGPSDARTAEAAPFNIQMDVSFDSIGTYELVAVGEDDKGDYYISNVVTLEVVPEGTLQSIIVVPQYQIMYEIGAQQQIQSLGEFSDGIYRNLIADSTNRFSVEDTSIATISADGTVTAVAAGVTEFTVTNGAITAGGFIEVSPDNSLNPPNFNQTIFLPIVE